MRASPGAHDLFSAQKHLLPVCPLNLSETAGMLRIRGMSLASVKNNEFHGFRKLDKSCLCLCPNLITVVW